MTNRLRRSCWVPPHNAPRNNGAGEAAGSFPCSVIQAINSPIIRIRLSRTLLPVTTSRDLLDCFDSLCLPLSLCRVPRLTSHRVLSPFQPHLTASQAGSIATNPYRLLCICRSTDSSRSRSAQSPIRMADYSTFKVPDLKVMLGQRKLLQTGNKQALIARLQEDDEKKNSEAPTTAKPGMCPSRPVPI